MRAVQLRADFELLLSFVMESLLPVNAPQFKVQASGPGRECYGDFELLLRLSCIVLRAIDPRELLAYFGILRGQANRYL